LAAHRDRARSARPEADGPSPQAQPSLSVLRHLVHRQPEAARNADSVCVWPGELAALGYSHIRRFCVLWESASGLAGAGHAQLMPSAPPTGFRSFDDHPLVASCW